MIGKLIRLLHIQKIYNIYTIILLGIVLRLVPINQSFWLDEGISAMTAIKPFPQQWTQISGDFQPPLYYLLLHFFMKFHIYSEWFLRIPSVIFGVVTIYILFKISKELFGMKNALLSATILAISQYHVYYSQELRMYSLLCLTTTMSMYLLYKRKWMLYTFVGIIGIYTSYMFCFIFVPQIVWLLMHKKLWLKVKKFWLKSICITFFTFSFWIPNFLLQWETGRHIVVDLPDWKNISSLSTVKIIPQLFLKFTFGRINFDNKLIYGFIFILLIILYLQIYKKMNLHNNTLYVLNWLFLPLIAIIISSLFIPLANIWRLMFIFPPFIILTAEGLLHSKHIKLLILFVITIHLSANILYWINPKYQREKWREVTTFIDQFDYPVIFTVENGFAPYLWYTKNKKLICGSQTVNLCLDSKNVFYIPYLSDLFDKENMTIKKIESNSILKETIDFSGVGFVYLYENSK